MPSGNVSWVNQQELAWQEGMRSGTLELEQKQHLELAKTERTYVSPAAFSLPFCLSLATTFLWPRSFSDPYLFWPLPFSGYYGPRGSEDGGVSEQ
jgi:hypothetical protein